MSNKKIYSVWHTTGHPEFGNCGTSVEHFNFQLKKIGITANKIIWSCLCRWPTVKNVKGRLKNCC